MTAGREQDARETLRALSEAATPGPWGWLYYDGFVGIVNDADASVLRVADDATDVPWLDVSRADADFIEAAVNYVRAALLPSPPATTGAGEARLIEALRHVTLCPIEPFACTHPLHAYATSMLHDAPPLIDTMRGAADKAEREGDEGLAVALRLKAAEWEADDLASPPATDGDAAARATALAERLADAIERISAALDGPAPVMRARLVIASLDVGDTETGTP